MEGFVLIRFSGIIERGVGALSDDEHSTERNRTYLKLRFYIMSLWLLFVIICLLTVDIPISFAPDATFIGVVPLLKRNILPLISIILAMISWLLACLTDYEWAGTYNPPYTIESVKNENYEYLTFLTTYIIPLACVDLNNIRYILVVAVLLFFIGLIFIRMDLYFGNPTLAFMGYKLYRVKIKNVAEEVVIITKDKISPDSQIKWIELSDNVWTAKEM